MRFGLTSPMRKILEFAEHDYWVNVYDPRVKANQGAKGTVEVTGGSNTDGLATSP